MTYSDSEARWRPAGGANCGLFLTDLCDLIGAPCPDTTRPHPVTGLAVPDETARAVVLDYPNPRPAEGP